MNEHEISPENTGPTDKVEADEPRAGGPVADGQTAGRRRRNMALPWLLLASAVTYFVVVGYHLVYPTMSASEGRTRTLLERCREICARYGLIPSGDLAQDAAAYLDAAQPNALTGDLQEVLADRSFRPVASQPHELVGRSAPGFELLDTTRSTRRLEQIAQGRPVVVVFYFGYFCNHCVAQLFGLERDLTYFHELGAEVIAISADLPEHTTSKFHEYGPFHFPVLSDPTNAVATAYGVYHAPHGDQPEQLEHGTFVIDSQGRVVWAQQGPEPFVDNKTLLFVLEQARREEGRGTRGEGLGTRGEE